MSIEFFLVDKINLQIIWKWQNGSPTFLDFYQIIYFDSFNSPTPPKMFLDPPLLASLSLHCGNLILINLFDTKTQLWVDLAKIFEGHHIIIRKRDEVE